MSTIVNKRSMYCEPLQFESSSVNNTTVKCEHRADEHLFHNHNYNSKILSCPHESFAKVLCAICNNDVC